MHSVCVMRPDLWGKLTMVLEYEYVHDVRVY